LHPKQKTTTTTPTAPTAPTATAAATTITIMPCVTLAKSSCVPFVALTFTVWSREQLARPLHSENIFFDAVLQPCDIPLQTASNYFIIYKLVAAG